MFFNNKVKTVYQIVEMPNVSKLPELTGDLKETLKALQYNPAFTYILQRMRIQKAGVANALKEGLTYTETQIRFLQAGAYWLEFMEKDIAKLTQTPASTPRDAFPTEAEEFEKVHRQLELVDA